MKAFVPRVFGGGSPSAPLRREGITGFSPWSGRAQMLLMLALCLAARLATTIHYIEDPDSLRFALAMKDYDVPRLQPHFPGYPAFCFAAKALYAATGRFSVAFSLLGGLGLFAILHVSLSLLRLRAATPAGAALTVLIAFNPMIWLLGNRYMPDLSGGALALVAFWLLARNSGTPPRDALTGFFLAGLLAGWRLSYVPFLLLPLAWNLLRAPGNVRRAGLLLAGCAGVLAWLIPLIAVTGWDALIAAAARHTAGHFNEFGGTYRTEPGTARRLLALFDGLWTDGLGAWTPGRHPVTIPVAAGATLFGALGAARAWRRLREPDPRRGPLVLLALSAFAYAGWILLFQNVTHQSRHVLPLMAPLLLLVAAGFPAPARGRAVHRAILAVFLASTAWTGATLALQHRQPSAIAQARIWVEAHAGPDALVICPPVVRDHLVLQGVRARILEAESPDDLPRIDPASGFARVLTVGDYSGRIGLPLAERQVFHHNPHVNRLWPSIEVFRYGDGP